METELDKFGKFMDELDEKIERKRTRELLLLSDMVRAMLTSEIRKKFKLGNSNDGSVEWWSLSLLGYLSSVLIAEAATGKKTLVFKKFIEAMANQLDS